MINGYMRIVTNRRIYPKPTPIEEALRFAELIRDQEHAVVINPGDRHWPIFTRLCQETGAMGELVPDVYLAALAIEHGCELITADRGFRSFPGLRWRYPFD